MAKPGSFRIRQVDLHDFLWILRKKLPALCGIFGRKPRSTKYLADIFMDKRPCIGDICRI